MATWQLTVEVLHEGGAVDVLQFRRASLTIGSAPTCDVVLPDPRVGRTHGKVNVSAGRLTYHDLSSSGSFIGGRRVADVQLGTDARIAIPPYEVAVRLASSAIRETARAAAPVQPYFRLTVIYGPQPYVSRRFIHLSADPVLIGSSPECGISFDCPTVSPRHAMLSLSPSGWAIEDLKSRDGTRVNGWDVQEPRPLNDGDEIEFGTEVVAVYWSTPDRAAAPPDEQVPRRQSAAAESRPAIRKRP